MKLISRIGKEYPLIPTEDDKKYQVDLTDSVYLRIGYMSEFEDEIGFIDPEGGPLIAVGSDAAGNKVSRITFEDNKYYLEFE